MVKEGALPPEHLRANALPPGYLDRVMGWLLEFFGAAT